MVQVQARVAGPAFALASVHMPRTTEKTRAFCNAPAVENIDEQIAELEARLAGSSVNVSAGGLAGEERQRVERQLSALQRSRR